MRCFRSNGVVLPEVLPSRTEGTSNQERKRHMNLRNSSGPRDTGRVSLGHPAGQTGVYRPVLQDFPVVHLRNTTSQRTPKGGEQKSGEGGGQNPTQNSFQTPPPPHLATFSLPPLFPPPIPFLLLSTLESQNFPHVPSSETIFGGSAKMVSKGPSSRGFAFRYVLPPPPPPLAVPRQEKGIFAGTLAGCPRDTRAFRNLMCFFLCAFFAPYPTSSHRFPLCAQLA